MILWIRIASRKGHLTYPPWLTCWLENPYFDAVANARAMLDRAFRDVHACTLLPPNNDVMLANIGKAQLSLAGTTFGLDAPEG